MKITENFTLEELCHSNTAEVRGIQNIPNSEQENNLKVLAIRLLQPLRERYGKPMVISSGFRCQEVNKLAGGVATSQHTQGKAADVSVNDPRNLLSILLASGLDFDQAILYDDGKNLFLHVSYNSGKNRKQVLYSKNTRP